MTSKMDPKLARKVIAEAAERAKRIKRLVAEDALFEQQLAFVRSKSKRKLAVCSRRAGKSYSIAWLLLEAAFQYPKSICVYITMSRASAKDIIWAPFVDLNDKYNLGLRFRQNTGDVVLPNGSKIILRGAGSHREIDKLRGPKYPIAVVDEAQGFGQSLRYLLQEVLEPATMDYDGTLVLAGTPNAACAGPFYEMAVGATKGWDVHHWTIMDNPNVPHRERWLADLRKERGWTEETAAYLREYRGKWVRDSEGLVFSIDIGRNTAPTFPKEATDDWIYVLGIDLGFNDPTAFSVLAYSARIRKTYVVKSYKVSKLIPSVAAAHVEAIREQFPISRIVADTGGFGKGYVEEWRAKYHIPVEAAKKTEKATYIEMLNGDFKTGVFQICTDNNEDLLDEMRLLQWDMTKVENGRFTIDRRFEDHLCDATLYAWRECKPHTYNDERDTPKPGERDYASYLEQKMIDKLAKAASTPWWARFRN